MNYSYSQFIEKTYLKKMLGLGPKCNKCGKSPGNETEKLQFCGACKKVEYCSKDCQKKDWKDHKTACKYFAQLGAEGETDGRSLVVDPHYYYHHIAPHTPKAQEFASEIGLKLPGQGRPSQGLM